MNLPKKVKLLKEYDGIPASTVLTKYTHGNGEYFCEVNGYEEHIPYEIIQAFLEVGVCEVVDDRWKPKADEYYFVVSLTGEVCKQIYYPDFDGADDYFLFGNCFKTREQAKEASKRIKKCLMDYQEELNK